MSGWVKRYSSYVNMTVAELKDFLKSKDLPVSGKKKDLIQYLIFDEYPATFDLALDTSIPIVGTGHWLERNWKQALKYIFYAAINRQEI
tara:strand:+ start:6470 stop:6736 length:267 start_codon:yes stop_codon:yes gene_type:complete